MPRENAATLTPTLFLILEPPSQPISTSYQTGTPISVTSAPSQTSSKTPTLSTAATGPCLVLPTHKPIIIPFLTPILPTPTPRTQTILNSPRPAQRYLPRPKTITGIQKAI